MSTISIITVAFNEAGNLPRLKGSFDRARVPEGWEVETVLVDNGSTDGTREAAEKLGFTKVVKAEGTIAAARNAGWRAASGEIVAYTDADCQVDGEWVEEIIRLVGEKERIAGWPVEPPRPMTWVQEAWHAHWTGKRGRLRKDERRKTVDGRLEEVEGRAESREDSFGNYEIREINEKEKKEEGEGRAGSWVKTFFNHVRQRRIRLRRGEHGGHGEEAEGRAESWVNSFFGHTRRRRICLRQGRHRKHKNRGEEGGRLENDFNVQHSTLNVQLSSGGASKPSSQSKIPAIGGSASGGQNPKSKIADYPQNALVSSAEATSPQSREWIGGAGAMTLITTANLSLRRETMERLGGFEEELESGEDMNLLLRAQGMGVEMVASPSLRVVHHGEPRTLREFYRQQKWHCSKRSFGRILRQGGNGRIRGGNAVWFTLAFGVGMVMGTAGVAGAVLSGNWWWLAGALPLAGLLAGPAVVIASRMEDDGLKTVDGRGRERFRHRRIRLRRTTFNAQLAMFKGRVGLAGRLVVLYAVYGWVRVMDLMGLVKRPRSWRSKAVD